MSTLTAVYTRRKWNPVSWGIRWAVPRSRFSLALGSHGMLVDGDHMIEAAMLHGVRRVPRDEAMKGQTIVRTVAYSVPDAEAGLAWARTQVGTPYDWRGAAGIGLDPDRDWQEPTGWFCYELIAAAIAFAGRDVFADRGHITEHILLSIKP